MKYNAQSLIQTNISILLIYIVIYIREYILSSNIFMLPICALNFLQTSRQCQGCCTLYHVTRKTGANNNILHGLDFTFLGDLWRSRNLYQICLDISIYWGRQPFTKDFDIFKVNSYVSNFIKTNIS